MALNAPRSRTIVLKDPGTSPFSAGLADYDGTIGDGLPFQRPSSRHRARSPPSGPRKSEDC